MNPHTSNNSEHHPDDRGNAPVARVDRLINAAMDAEAANDFDGANIAWAKIAAMDDASRRSAAALQAGLESLRAPAQTPDVSAKVLTRLGMTPPTVRHESHQDHSAPGATPSAHKPQAKRVSRKWYSISPLLSSFVLGGLVCLGLVIAHQYTKQPAQRNTEIVVIPQSQFSLPSTPAELLPTPVAAARRTPSLQLGDVSRYDNALLIPTGHVAEAPLTNAQWWKADTTQPTILAQERWWTGTSEDGIASEFQRVNAGQSLPHHHAGAVDLFEVFLGGSVAQSDAAEKHDHPVSKETSTPRQSSKPR